MDFYAMLAALVNLNMVVLGRRYTGLQAVLQAVSPNAGSYLRAQLSDAVAGCGVNLDAVYTGLYTRISRHWAALKSAQGAADAAGEAVDAWQDHDMYDVLPESIRTALSRVDLACGKVLVLVGQLKNHGTPTLERLASTAWVQTRGELASELDWARSELAQTLRSLSDAESRLNPPTPVEPVQLSLNLAPPVRVIPEGLILSTDRDNPDWTQEIYPL